jgi:hypothetical protein
VHHYSGALFSSEVIKLWGELPGGAISPLGRRVVCMKDIYLFLTKYGQ